MPKTYTPPAAFNHASEYIDIALTPVTSSQVKAVGYDEASRTLAVTFVHGIGSVYQYQGVGPQVHAAFIAPIRSASTSARTSRAFLSRNSRRPSPPDPVRAGTGAREVIQPEALAS